MAGVLPPNRHGGKASNAQPERVPEISRGVEERSDDTPGQHSADFSDSERVAEPSVPLCPCRADLLRPGCAKAKA